MHVVSCGVLTVLSSRIFPHVHHGGEMSSESSNHLSLFIKKKTFQPKHKLWPLSHLFFLARPWTVSAIRVVGVKATVAPKSRPENDYFV